MPADEVNPRVFEATATREGKWWIVDVGGVGVTQGRTADEARTMAAGLVAAVLGIDQPLVAFRQSGHRVWS